MADSRALLERLLNTPNLEKIVPTLQPAILHRVIEQCGLEDSAELIALATPEQLTQVLDLDVWRTRAPVLDEVFDADRFGVWIAVLMESGTEVAAEKILRLDIELVIAGLARHLAVFDNGVAAFYTTLDGEQMGGPCAHKDVVSGIGGYAIETRRTSAWDPIVELLAFLATEHPEYFHRLMRGCVHLSSGTREADGFHDLLQEGEQDMFDLASDRESRREQQGYVSPAQARAFLTDARELRLDAMPPARSPIAAAYFRPNEPTAAAGDDTAGIFQILLEAGVLTPRPRGLPGPAEPRSNRLALIEAYLTAHPASAEELVYLVNAVMAGCSIQNRPFTAQEASDAAIATCNLGLENWPSHWPAGDLVTAFQVGWNVLYRNVCVHAAESLVATLQSIRCTDREIQLRLDGLRGELIRHIRAGEPWRVRNDLDAILSLDTVAWAGLLGLIDECSVLHAAAGPSRKSVLRITPGDFEFIAENIQVASVREFLAALPSLL
jgi:uncharacterized protein DUF6178